MIETTMPETYDETASVMRVLLDQLHATEADRDELAAQVNSMQYELDAVTAIKAERDAWKQAHDEQVAKLIEIANERDALKADAERYRWMSAQIVNGDLEVLEKAFGTLDPQAESVTQAEFDGVIDAALKAVL